MFTMTLRAKCQTDHLHVEWWSDDGDNAGCQRLAMQPFENTSEHYDRLMRAVGPSLWKWLHAELWSQQRRDLADLESAPSTSDRR